MNGEGGMEDTWGLENDEQGVATPKKYDDAMPNAFFSAEIVIIDVAGTGNSTC